jgi:hypothetical protein
MPVFRKLEAYATEDLQPRNTRNMRKNKASVTQVDCIYFRVFSVFRGCFLVTLVCSATFRSFVERFLLGHAVAALGIIYVLSLPYMSPPSGLKL